MIRPLREFDRASVIELLSVAPALNLYMLGNIEANGFESDFCEFYGDVEDGRVRAVANRYMTGWVVYGDEDADWASLGALVDAHEVVAERLQDNAGGIDSFLPFLQRYTIASLTEDQLMELPPGALNRVNALPGFEIRKATMSDLALLVDLFHDAGDMSRTPSAVERPLRDRRVWLALKEGEAVSVALTNAETTTLAMIGGVYTRPKWRGHGLSQAVCSGLCEELIAGNRQPVLYWHYPPAGHVYRKLGFRPIGTWRSVKLALR